LPVANATIQLEIIMYNVTWEEIKSDFDYIDGELIRKNSKRSHLNGKIAGGINGCGYRIIKYKNQTIYAHHLVWFYHYGKWPEKDIDHINRDRHDNRIENIREATKAENAQNIIPRKHNSTGTRIPGVSWNSRLKKYKVTIVKDYVYYHGGYYNNLEEAELVSFRLRKQMFPFFNQQLILER